MVIAVSRMAAEITDDQSITRKFITNKESKVMYSNLGGCTRCHSNDRRNHYLERRETVDATGIRLWGEEGKQLDRYK